MEPVGETPQFPHFEAPEVPEPRKTIPGSIGCFAAFLAGLALVGVIVAYFYSMSDYSTELNVDGTYHFTGTLGAAHKVIFSDRYKLAIRVPGKKDLVLPPLPSPRVDGRPVFPNARLGVCANGDITVKRGFLNDLSLELGDQRFHFDADAGWLIRPPEPPPAPPGVTPAK
jgi:hypothetical protein